MRSRHAPPRAMVSRSALCAGRAVNAVGQATGHHRSGGNGFVIVSPQGVQVIETSAVVHDVSAERLWGGHTNHYVSGKFDRVATSDEESAHRLEQALATVGAAKAREMRDTGRFLVQSPGFVPGSPDGSVVTAFACSPTSNSARCTPRQAGAGRARGSASRCRGVISQAGSRRTRRFRARGSADRRGSAGWRRPRRRRPASRTPARSPRRASSGLPPP